MSLPVFRSAFGRALARQPLSFLALAGFNGSVIVTSASFCSSRSSATAATTAKPHSASSCSQQNPDLPLRCTYHSTAATSSFSAGRCRDDLNANRNVFENNPTTPPPLLALASVTRKRRIAERGFNTTAAAATTTAAASTAAASTAGNARVWERQSLGTGAVRRVSPRRRRPPPGPPPPQGTGSRFYKTPVPRLRSLLIATGTTDIPIYHPGKKDLSFVNPFTLSWQHKRGQRRWRRWRRRRRRKMVALGKNPRNPWRMTRHSLKEITASFIYYCNLTGAFQGGRVETPKPPPPKGKWTRRWSRVRSAKDFAVVRRVFGPKVMSYLQKTAFAPKDVMMWAWILTARDGLGVGHRLSAAVRAAGSAEKNLCLPPFVILSILQRKHLLRSTLQMLLQLVEDLYSSGRTVDNHTTVLFAIRLLRHFRRTAPAALPRVADLITKYLYAAATANPSSERLLLPSGITHTFNRLLSLFSLPTADRPYRNAVLLQQCQFALIQRMAAVGAPVTREGYRAIIAVQLAQHKTPEEAEKVRNMRKNWPPWFSERDGWSAVHRLAHQRVVSRGGQAIRQMVEAGYGLMDWGDEAMVLAGKDTDSTPTIQTRSFWNKQKLGRGDTAGHSPRIWAARVRATRTLDEAWFHFCECRAQCGVPHPDVWAEMMERVVWQEKLVKLIEDWSATRKSVSVNTYVSRPDFWLRKTAEQLSKAVPGDGKELVPRPTNPSAGIYNPEPPPSVEDLFGMMVRDGLRPPPRLVALIVGEADLSIPFSMAVLRHWDSDQAFQMLYPLYRNPPKNAKPSAKPLNLQVLTALLNRLCKHHQPLKAFKVLSHRPPAYRPAWNAVLRGFVSVLSPRVRNPTQHPHRLESIRAVWSLYKTMSALVDADNTTLRCLCMAAERWITLPDAGTILWDGRPPPDAVALLFFDSLTAAAGFGLTPDPAALHAFVRTLGLARKHADIEHLLVLLAEQDVPLGEDAMGRRVLRAARVFLEGAGYGVPEGDPERSGAGWGVIDRLTPVVQDRWGGWGEDFELEEYLILAGMVRGKRAPAAE